MNTVFPNRPRRAFTLIELLVVIAIIAILAAILFPVFGRARENARRTTCQSNMKQIGLAMIQYAQDFDEQMPYCLNATGAAGGTITTWDYLIEPYASKGGTKTSGGIYYGTGVSAPYLVCPSDTVSRPTPNGVKTYSPRSYALAGSPYNNSSYAGVEEAYPWGGKVVDPASGNTYTKGKTIAAIPKASETLMVVEAPIDDNFLGGFNVTTVYCPSKHTSYRYNQDGTNSTTTNGSNWAMGKKGSHFEGWNYLFFDGHVKFLKPEATIGTKAYYKDATTYYCTATLARPCGMWTTTEDD